MSNSIALDNRHGKTFLVLLCLIFLLPWPHGGELNWEYLPFMASIFAMFAVLLLKTGGISAELRHRLREVRFPLVLLICWVTYQFLQVLPLPVGFVHALNPQSMEVKNALSALTPTPTLPPSTSTLSIAPGLTLIEALKNASYVGFFIVGLLLLSSKPRIIATVQVMFATSTAMALYSLINHYTDGNISIFTSIPPWTISWKQSAHGSFSYQNHYASFLTLTIPLGFGLMYQASKKRTNKSAGKNISERVVDFLLSGNGLYLLGTALMLLALMKTASRGGNIVLVVSIILTSFSLAVVNKNKQASTTAVYTVFALLLSIPVVIGTGIADGLFSRYSEQGLDPSGRDYLHQTARTVIGEYPVFGSGAGTYPILQQKFKAPELGNSAMSKRAHNDYLELLSDQGIIGFFLAGIAIVMLLGKALIHLRRNNSSLYGIQIACFCSITAILIHSAAEFNFHLPVNAAYFYLLLALGVRIPIELIQKSAPGK